VLLLFNDSSFQRLVALMKDESLVADTSHAPSSPMPASPRTGFGDEPPNNDLLYHVDLVQLLARLTEGVNVNTEIKCQVRIGACWRLGRVWCL
jgi:hypothetical protein